MRRLLALLVVVLALATPALAEERIRSFVSEVTVNADASIDVTETILNHISGSRSQIQRIYDRHDRLPEMRDALALYEKHLAAIIAPK
mgnify:CR=1 FL=1